MPIVPTYEGPQLRQAALEGGMQRPEDISSGPQQLAKGLDDAAAVLDKIDYSNALRDANAAGAKTREDWAQQDQVLRNTLKGNRAGEYIPAAQKWWDDRKTQLGEALTPRARGLMDKSLGVARAQAFRSGEAWAGQEDERTKLNNYNANLSATITTPLNALATRDTTAMAQVATANTLLEKNIAAFGVTQGWSPEVIADQTLKARTDLNTEAIRQLATTDPAAARTYFDKVVKENMFDSRKVDDMNTYLKAKTTTALGGAEARAAFASVVTDPKDGAIKKYVEVDPYKMVSDYAASVKGQPNAEDKIEAFRTKLLEQVALYKAGNDSYTATNVRGVFDVFNKTGSAYSALNSTAASALPPDKRAEMKATLNDRVEHVTVQQQNIFDRERTPAYLEYSRPEVLSKMTEDQVAALHPKLGDRLYKDIEQKYTTWKKNDAALSEGHIDQDAFDTAVSRAGLEPRPKATDKDAAGVLKGIKEKVEFEIGQRQQKSTRPLTREEKDKVVSDIIGKTVLEKPWTIFGARVPGTGGTPVIQAGINPTKLKDYNVEVELPDATGELVTQALSVNAIPKAQFDNTALSLKRRKLPHTDADVIREWASLQRELATAK